jgi:arsenical pump membrane protein
MARKRQFNPPIGDTPVMLMAVADHEPVENRGAVEDGSNLEQPRPGHRGLGWILAGIGLAGLVAASVLHSTAARSAGAQDWPPFVLVAGLLLIGVVADEDGLFAAVGHRLARTAPSGIVLFGGAVAMIGVVTALLNLDTSVAFLTPVLIYAARSRGGGEAPLLYGCLLLSNAGSLFLPGSNLTNLIVLGHLHLSGGQFLAHMWAPALVALVATAVVIACFERRSLRVRIQVTSSVDRPVFGLGLVGVLAATVLVVLLNNPAIPVAAVGIAVVGVRVVTHQEHLQHVVDMLEVPVLVGLFGVAVTLGTVGRVWSGPADLLAHLDRWGTAGVAAVSSVLVNNLPAASLLAARRPEHPYSLLIGLNLGPNLFVSGSLAWFLWLRAARSAGAQPSVARASRLGLVAVPLSMACALAVLTLSGLG